MTNKKQIVNVTPRQLMLRITNSQKEMERIVDMSAFEVLSRKEPILRDRLTTFSDNVERSCRDFFRSMHANGIHHARISIDCGITSGKIEEILPEESHQMYFMALVGLFTLNVYPHLDKDGIAKLYGLGSHTHMAALVPELCRGDGHFLFTRGQELTRDMVKRIVPIVEE